MTVGAVVVSHRTPVRARTCADSLHAAGVDEVVVVDAGSGDGSAAHLRERDVTVLAEANLGFGRCANAGVASLGELHDVVIVCNADTTWTAGSVDVLAAAVRAPGVAAAGPTVTYPDGRAQASARRLPSLGTALGHALFGLWWPDNPWTRRYRRVDDDDATAREVDWLSGCALALDRAAFTAVGGFDPAYFLYAEDVDLCVRLREAGHQIVTAPDAHVVHEVAASTSHHRGATVVAHARSLDLFAARHVLTGPRRLLRPLVRVALAGWVATTLVWDRLLRRGRSTTGE